MTTITFDMLEMVDKLRVAGFGQNQAEAVVRVITEAQNTLVSNSTLDSRLKETELRLDSRFERVDGELKLLRWMVGLSIALSTGTIALLAKLFFILPH
jgi:hypothetical protein